MTTFLVRQQGQYGRQVIKDRIDNFLTKINQLG